MFNINGILIIASINFDDGNKYVFSLNQDKLVLPEINIQKNLDTELDALFEKQTNFGAGWTTIKLIKAEIIDNQLDVYYLAKIPFESIINGFWIKGITASIINSHIKDCLIHV
jgi:hypothetical protein